MAKAEIVGEVAMLVVADAGKFTADLQKKIKKAVTALARANLFAPLEESLAESGRRGGEEFTREVSRHIDRDSKRVGRKGGKGFLDGFQSLLKGGSLFGSILDDTAKGLGGLLSGIPAVGGLAGALGSLGGSLAATGPPGLIALAAGLTALVAVAPAAIALITALGGALFSLIGILAGLPAAAGIAVAALLPLVVGFQGFGDAVSALMSGDMDKFEEALANLSPSARKVAREFKALLPVFKDIRVFTQESLFKPLTGDLTKLSRILGPTVKRGFGQVAGSFGKLFSGLAAGASGLSFRKTLEAIFGTTSRLIDLLAKPSRNLFAALTSAAAAGLPIIEKFLSGIGPTIDKFAAFIVSSVNDGSFQTFLEEGLASFSSLVALGNEFFLLISDIFLETDEGGRTFLDSMTQALKDLREYFASEEGKRFLEDLTILANALAASLSVVAGMLRYLLYLAADATRQVNELLKLFGLAEGRTGKMITNSKPKPKGFARGGEVSQDGLYRLAEGNKREVILPMSNPARARQVAAQTGVTAMLGQSGGTPSFDITVLIGDTEITDIVDTQVKKSSKSQARQLANGPREG